MKASFVLGIIFTYVLAIAICEAISSDLPVKRKYNPIPKSRLKRNPEKVRRKYRKKKPSGLKTKNGSKRKRKPRKSGIRKRFENMNKVYKDLWKEVEVSNKCSCGPIYSKKKDGRIVNGEEATPHEYPWIISMLDSSGYWYCGGTILSDQWIISASHCVDGSKAKDVFIRVGDHDNTDPDDTKFNKKQTFGVKKILMHPGYDPQTVNNDVALLKLDKKINFKDFDDTVAPICLPEKLKAYSGEKVTVAGWGLLKENGDQPSKLRKVDLEVLPMHTCRDDYGYKKSWITSRMLCTFAKDQDACQGDSGGPLIWENKDRGVYELIGVVSWGIGCASRNHPGVFAKLSYFLPWVMRKTSSSTYCSA